MPSRTDHGDRATGVRDPDALADPGDRLGVRCRGAASPRAAARVDVEADELVGAAGAVRDVDPEFFAVQAAGADVAMQSAPRAGRRWCVR